MREIVFVHGIRQGGKDPDALKQQWIAAWQEGLALHGLTVPEGLTIHFPYYGDTLDALTDGVDAPDVIVRGVDDGGDADEQAFLASVLQEASAVVGLSEAELAEVSETTIIEKGPQNAKWVLAIVRALDRRYEGASGTAISVATRDVWRYLTSPGARDVIEGGVASAITPGVETVVVGHSLGSVVTYLTLKSRSAELGWTIPALITVGSPLGVSGIRQLLAPIAHPIAPGSWFNARDPHDLVALYPLDADRFGVQPAVENYSRVANTTPNHHGIAGYLNDPLVARRLYDAVVG